MGKKNKKEKGRGAEKTAQKMLKKSKKDEEMADLEAMICKFKEEDKLKTTYHEEKCPHPSPRTNLSMCMHPEKEEILFFGGEYFNGKNTVMYNEIFVYRIKKNEWSKRFAPNPPPPRCAHQAVVVAKEEGQMWVFGGEFSSPNNAQFYHYKDLWCLSLKEHKWKQIKSPNGPSPRSGHRMCVYNKNLFVFGGFHESNRDFIYFNDSYIFNLSDNVWTKLVVSGSIPSPRSACQLAVTPSGVLVVGGYSKTRVKKDVEKGTAHCDMFLLSHDSKWKWQQVKDSGQKPWPRSGFSLTQISATRSVLFGGVQDEDDEENIESVFYNSMSCLDVNSNRWFDFALRNSKNESDEEMDHDGKVTNQPSTIPCPRMNVALGVKKHVMYLYGGIVESGQREITLNDLWSIDIKKMDEWKELVKSDNTADDWQEEDPDDDEDSEEDDEQISNQMNWTNNDTVFPEIRQNDSLPSYWFRTRENWLEIISAKLCEEGRDEDTKADEISAFAEKEARLYFAQQTKEEETK